MVEHDGYCQSCSRPRFPPVSGRFPPLRAARKDLHCFRCARSGGEGIQRQLLGRGALPPAEPASGGHRFTAHGRDGVHAFLQTVLAPLSFAGIQPVPPSRRTTRNPLGAGAATDGAICCLRWNVGHEPNCQTWRRVHCHGLQRRLCDHLV
jgi:hypothetical protein